MKPEEKKARGIVEQEVLALISSFIEQFNEGAARTEAYFDDLNAVGTKHYKGIASFWNREYKQTMRLKTVAEKKAIHYALLAAKLDPSGKSKDHDTIIWCDSRACDEIAEVRMNEEDDQRI